MATYVLVHGGSHGGWCYKKLSPLLRAAGHEVHSPTLTGLGEREHLLRPDVNLDLHITDVVNLLEYEDLANVILVGHSYGGMVITGVADRARGVSVTWCISMRLIRKTANPWSTSRRR